MYHEYKHIVLFTFANSVIIVYHIIHVRAIIIGHFASCLGRCGCTAKCQDAGMQYRQRMWTHKVISSMSMPMQFTKECRTCLIVSRETDRRLMPYCPDNGTHRSITNYKASQASPIFACQATCILHWYLVSQTEWPGSQCTRHQNWMQQTSRMQQTSNNIIYTFM